MMAREPTVSRLSAESARSASDTVVQFGPSESAFMARQSPRQDSRPDLRQDSRLDSRHDSRKDISVRQDSRRLAPSWDRRPDSQDRPRQDRPSSASGTLRMDDDDRHELLLIQQQLQSLVAKVSGKTSSFRNSAFLTDEFQSERPAAPQVAYHASVVSDNEDAEYEADWIGYSRPL